MTRFLVVALTVAMTPLAASEVRAQSLSPVSL